MLLVHFPQRLCHGRRRASPCTGATCPVVGTRSNTCWPDSHGCGFIFVFYFASRWLICFYFLDLRASLLVGFDAFTSWRFSRCGTVVASSALLCDLGQSHILSLGSGGLPCPPVVPGDRSSTGLLALLELVRSLRSSPTPRCPASVWRHSGGRRPRAAAGLALPLGSPRAVCPSPRADPRAPEAAIPRSGTAVLAWLLTCCLKAPPVSWAPREG